MTYDKYSGKKFERQVLDSTKYRKSMSEADLRWRIAQLELAIDELLDVIRPFAEEAGVGPMPGEPDDPRRCNMKFLRAAREVYLKRRPK